MKSLLLALGLFILWALWNPTLWPSHPLPSWNALDSCIPEWKSTGIGTIFLPLTEEQRMCATSIYPFSRWLSVLSAALVLRMYIVHRRSS